MKPHLFLNYAREDRSQVEELQRALVVAGFDAWMDIGSLSGGEQWRIAIEREIVKSDFFIACLTQQSITKRGVVRDEIEIALGICRDRPNEDIFLIPVRLEACPLPQELLLFNFI